MKLYLIRHGETVDNVAGLYAGSKDSALTNFGFDQAKRLGDYFAEHNVRFTHIFASPLSRAFRTAGAVRDAQTKITTSSGDPVEPVEVVKVQELVERDYGAYEGRPFSSKSEWTKTGRGGVDGAHGNVESSQSLARRGDTFLDRDLLPLFSEDGDKGEYTVAVVAHGMLLSHLWRRLLLRLPRKSLTIAPDVVAAKGDIVLEHLGSWSNAAYLELLIRKGEEEQESRTLPIPSGDSSGGASEAAETATLPTPIPPPLQAEGADVSIAPPQPSESKASNNTSARELVGYATTILAIDSRKHLFGLKRQKGGIGSLANDQGQKKLDTFFKPQ